MRPVSKAEAAGHSCIRERCAQRNTVASREHVRWLDVQREQRGARMCDNLDRKDVAYVVGLGLSEKDMENLKRLAEADGRVKNYAVLVRRLIAREAKAL